MPGLLLEAVAPLQKAGRPNWPVVIMMILINGLVLANVVLHDPRQGYDAADHINYMRTLAVRQTIPSCKDTAQCYVPPLPYLLPAAVLATGRITLWQAAKLAQLVNLILSLCLTYYLVKICEMLKPGSTRLKVTALAMLGILPVYYKTFAMIRGETYLALLCVFAAYQLLAIFMMSRASVANILMLGFTVGFAILARQWGFLLLPAILVFAAYVALRQPDQRRLAFSTALSCLLVPLVVAGWYYWVMYQRYGTLLAAGWDRNTKGSSATPLPAEFFLGTGSGKLFTDPVRPNFSNQFPAIFYSDTWGDYGAYFLIYGRDRSSGSYVSGTYLERVIAAGPPLPVGFMTNRDSFGAYLGRVNLVSLLPAALLAAGFLYALMILTRSLRREPSAGLQLGTLFSVLFVACSMAGYMWFLIRYQNNGQAGDLIKTSHMLQVFPFLAIMAGGALEKIRARSRPVWIALVFGLALVAIHNLPAMVTHYTVLP
jgi:hypothetical protein